MPSMPPMLRPAGWKPRALAARETDARRGSATARGYDRRWNKASASYRREHPLCEYCELEGRVTASALTDHLYPHRVYAGVFWLSKWWVASCDQCHNGMKQAAERKGKDAIDALARRLGREVHGQGGVSENRGGRCL